MPLLHLDTHVAAWLWSGDRTRLRPVWSALRRSELAVSPAVVLELGFLYEIGRIAEPAKRVIHELVGAASLQVSTTPFERVCEEALGLGWTRDPFDRLIVAHARIDGARLITRDRTILERCAWASWG